MTAGSVLVTGGAGFIGSHVVEALLARGRQATVLDGLSTGRTENLPDDPRVHLVVGDVADPRALADALRGCRWVVHLAATASVQHSIDDPIGSHRVNYEATLRLLEGARRSGVERIVYASSAAIYGDAQQPPVDELGPLDPQTPYAIDKLAGEQALAFYRRVHGLQGVALRFFNVYGPRQRDDSPYSGVISLFQRRVRCGEAVTVFGDGGQTRDFVYVADVAHAVVELLLRPEAPPATAINVGSGRATSVLDLMDAVESTVGARLARSFAAPRSGEVRHSRANVERLRGALGWIPTTTLETGLRRCSAVAAPPSSLSSSCTDAPVRQAFGDYDRRRLGPRPQGTLPLGSTWRRKRT
ncbi:MAG: NAD-dependent epimerase/dehydratase family protein [bacterium]|nr:NAD-dependent epimerase/dehydratase family protein [bacterium]